MTKAEKAILGFASALGAFFGIKKLVEAKPPVEKPAIQLKLEWHSDPTFLTGSVHSASVIVTNPTDWYWEYELELFVGGTSLGAQDVALNARSNGTLAWDITMPTVEGVYPVYIMAKCNTTGESLGKFPFESVTIVSPFDPWVYDVNDNGYIDYNELLTAGLDWTSHLITDEQYQVVSALYGNRTHRPGSMSAPSLTVEPPSWT